MKKIFIIMTIIVLSGCHVTGHNEYYDRPVFNGLVLGGLIAIL